MSCVLGIDPGASSGALALVDNRGKLIFVVDMPVWDMPVGKKVRKRLDHLALIDILEDAKMFGAELVAIEAVGGRPKQNASAAFAFGYAVGQVHMACTMLKLPLEAVSPVVWKRTFRVSGKTTATDAAIISRAEELFIDHNKRFRGPKGGKLVDRAEAAMIGLFGVQQIRMDDSEAEPSTWVKMVRASKA